MEEETYTRWLFPGAFAVGTFLWLGYNFNTLNRILTDWGKILIPLVVTGVPIVGLLTGNLVRLITNDYTGWGCWRSKVRKLCKNRFEEVSQLLEPFKVCNKDTDVLFSLAALGVIKDHSMPELLIKHGRRRWTTCWTMWNSTIGMVFGVVGYIIFCGLFPWKCETIVPLFCIATSLICVGLIAHLKEEELELGWFVLTYGANGEELPNLLQRQLKDP